MNTEKPAKRRTLPGIIIITAMAEAAHLIIKMASLPNDACTCTYLNPWQHGTCCAFTPLWHHLAVIAGAFIISLALMMRIGKNKGKQ